MATLSSIIPMYHTNLDNESNLVHDDLKERAINMKSNQHSDLMTGVILICTTALAIILANNSATESIYLSISTLGLGIKFSHHSLDSKFLINEILMCVFFFNIGLELKYALYNGALKDRKVSTMSLIAAIGGMLIPALIFLQMNSGPMGQVRGWAIPTATDIAFAIGLLSLVENKIPKSLKAFLLALAIYDDIGAIIIIGLFYSHKIHLLALASSALITSVMLKLNRLQYMKIHSYIVLGMLLWIGLFITGIHTTLSGVICALCIPMTQTKDKKPTYEDANNIYLLSKKITPYINYMILPIFAFYNAGTNISTGDGIWNPIGIGIITGLVIGKPVGILTACYLGKLFGLCELPKDATWRQIAGIGFLCGIGFTMSLFIGKLAFHKPYHKSYLEMVKKSVLTGSAAAAVLGIGTLSFTDKRKR
ncbi:MAG: Na+/H+ antiporter NhaA [Pseudomonadota bacterium]|nr:Na+/H+ antiporter NhaA [Pseudomonadota bacterium]